jgi:DNA-binding response OmpR family regulator
LIRRSQHQVSNEKLAVRNMMLEPGTLKVTRAGRELLAQPIGMKLLAI